MDGSSAKADVTVQTKPGACETHGDFESRGLVFRGKVLNWSGCPVCLQAVQDKKAADDAIAEAADRQRRMENRMRQAGIPLRFRDKTFAAFVADTDGKEKARAIAMEFATNFQKHQAAGTSVIFSGKPGTGKSHLAIAIAQAVMERGGTALYTSAIDAIRMVRETWKKGSERSEREVLEVLASVDLLVMDEIGVQYGTDAEQVTLFDIIDKRYRDMMPTILLTNLNKTGMKEFLGERSFDRLREGGIWQQFDWESQRPKVAA